MEFEHVSFPSHVLFGVGSTDRDQLVSTIEELDPKRILIVAAEAEGELADRFADALGSRVAGRFSHVRPHVPIEVAREARHAADSVHADCVPA